MILKRSKKLLSINFTYKACAECEFSLSEKKSCHPSFVYNCNFNYLIFQCETINHVGLDKPGCGAKNSILKNKKISAVFFKTV